MKALDLNTAVRLAQSSDAFERQRQAGHDPMLSLRLGWMMAEFEKRAPREGAELVRLVRFAHPDGLKQAEYDAWVTRMAKVLREKGFQPEEILRLPEAMEMA